MTVRDQLVELGLELATRLSSQQQALANARSATTALSRARVERDSVELFLAELDELDDRAEPVGDDEKSRASGS